MISMVEHPELEWNGRFSYLAAKAEQKKTEVYAWDLIWLLAKVHYDGLKQPSDVYYKQATVDRRSGKQIADDLIKGLGGE